MCVPILTLPWVAHPRIATVHSLIRKSSFAFTKRSYKTENRANDLKECIIYVLYLN